MAEGFIGRIIDRKYRLLAELGRGAMGVVYRAEQLDIEGHLQRQVALKTMRVELSADPDLSRRFLREVRVAMQLSSPHIVTVHDSGRDETGQLYYTMELIRGQTLRDLLQQQRALPVERAVHIIGQICAALTEAHTLPEPIIHRDLKPANIFIGSRQGQDWVKIGDFGIAKVLSEHTTGLTHTGMQSPGTPRYMAPEQWMGKTVDGRTDLYALGIILYEMLTGQPPFTTDGGPLALMYQHLNEQPPSLPAAVPAGIRTQVGRLLAKAPQERPQNALSVRRALEAALKDEDKQETVILGQQSAGPSGGINIQAKAHEVPPAKQPAKTSPPKPVVQPTSLSSQRRFPWRMVLAIIGSVSLVGVIAFYLPAALQQRRAQQQAETQQREAQQQAEEAGRQAEAAEAARKAEEARRQAEAEEARRRAEAEEAKRQEEEVKRHATAAEAKRKAEEAVKQQMVEVPAGEFFMGCNEKVDKECDADEKPGRTVTLNAFSIDKYEITVADYRRCVEAGKCSDKDLTTYNDCNWNKSGRAAHPINCMDWNQAKAYCEWAGKRLPTEAEWEKAARGTEGRKYPWGNEWDRRKANVASEGTMPVGSFPAGASPYDVLDMAGNVWEWTADWYEKDKYCSVRGGSWRYGPRLARASSRFGHTPGGRDGIGFRCAQ